MTDYNFFLDYQVKKKKRSPGIRAIMVLYTLIFIGIASFIGYNYYRINEKSHALAAVENELAALKSNDDIARIHSKQQLLNTLKNIVTNIDNAQMSINSNGSVNENMIALLVDAMPIDVELSNFSIANLSISANGSAASKPAIAEFEYNLRKMDSVNSVAIGAITRADEGFIFNIDIVLATGGDSNEN